MDMYDSWVAKTVLAMLKNCWTFDVWWLGFVAKYYAAIYTFVLFSETEEHYKSAVSIANLRVRCALRNIYRFL